ncbi:hypothetical protein HanXRQr2_Chr01g0006431 [Helianthus annuus]|uniref:Uncharacterized protein n=1 Tax=Helianthus annuus TaxID=4232 RepID=A0A9K3P155_HELAN|nr:uncharacterized protein LOC110944790 [Helianthus annuus]KAF5820807.1 hypothetical protein HanXRQr2_Chr01g0006431 [Helianthus annuus]KAJ0610571.1 hypothetical protein HanHA300_Chr01g0005261 [Helianthus annuus]KAJ0621305.1 hypothetical protein HanIR_Chr01g0007181 [Helianthus annuus]KAJ0625821.1 hypothetical protein HanHA89_Chr01g0005951 [Helianthus annuus]KAJ0782180.1 hypothetical protein HanLR1_Chr01g0005191 [Helianthus annuus]
MTKRERERERNDGLRERGTPISGDGSLVTSNRARRTMDKPSSTAVVVPVTVPSHSSRRSIIRRGGRGYREDDDDDLVDDGDDGGHTAPPCGGGSRNGCCGSSLVSGLICYRCGFWFGSGHSSVSGLGQRQSTSQRFGLTRFGYDSSLVQIGQLVSVRVFGSTRSTRLTQSNQSVNSASQLS